MSTRNASLSGLTYPTRSAGEGDPGSLNVWLNFTDCNSEKQKDILLLGNDACVTTCPLITPPWSRLISQEWRTSGIRNSRFSIFRPVGQELQGLFKSDQAPGWRRSGQTTFGYGFPRIAFLANRTVSCLLEMISSGRWWGGGASSMACPARSWW